MYEDAATNPANEGVVWPYKERVYDPAEDEGFIYKNWINALSNANPYRVMQYSRFAERQRCIIRRILCRPRVQTVLAVQEDCGEPKFGWICYEWSGPIFVLHFIYMRKHYRNKKIASRLLMSAGVEIGKTPVVYTARTKAITYLIEAWNLDFDPFLAWEEADAHHKYHDSKRTDVQRDGLSHKPRQPRRSIPDEEDRPTQR